MFFNPFKMAVQTTVLLDCIKVPNFDGLFFPNSTGPGPQIQKGRKIPEGIVHVY